MSGPDPDRADRFRRLHLETYADLLRFVERRVPAGEAEDIVSAVFLTAWRRFDDISDDARPWLFAVARKTMANGNRGWLRRQALDVRLGAQESRDAGDSVSGSTVRIDLERAWRTLRPADREVLALIAFDGLTTEQAATVLGVRRTAFAMRLSRARERLRAALEPAHPSPSHDLKEQAWTA